MANALNVYPAATASSVLATADQLYANVENALNQFTTWSYTRIGTATGWGEVQPLGTTSAWAGLASPSAPTGRGLMLDTTLLDGQDLIAGAWSYLIRLDAESGGSPSGGFTADIRVRAYKYSGGTYTAIGEGTLTGQSITTSYTNYTVSFTTAAAVSFGAGDKLYIDVWLHVTTPSGDSLQDVRYNRLSTDTTGLGGDPYAKITTPGYQVSGGSTQSGAAALGGGATATATVSAILSGAGAFGGSAAAAITTFQSADMAVTAGASAGLSANAIFAAAAAPTGSGAATFSPTRQVYTPPIPRGLRVVHAGQDISDYVREVEDGDAGGSPADFSLESSLAQGSNSAGAAGATAAFTVALGPAAKAVGKASQATGTTIVRQGDVQIYDARGNLIFGGNVTKLDDASYGVNVRTVFNCVDYWQSLDRVEVQQVFTGANDTDILISLLTSYAPWVDRSLIPATGNYYFAKRVCKGTLRQVLQDIANVTGFLIWIDPSKKLHYAAPTSASTAPFDLSDNPNSVTSFGYSLTKYEVDDNAIINRVYFYGGKNTSPDFTQDLSPQANGVNTAFLLAYPPDNASDGAKHIVQNGVELVVGSVFDKTSNGTFKSQGGNCDVLLNATQQLALFDVAPLKTDTLVAKYRYQTPLVVVLSDQQSFNFYGGWFDGRIADKTVFDVQTALQRCRLKLAQQSRGLVSISLTTWTPGLQAGQLVHLTNALRGIDDTFLIQKVTLVPLGYGEFEYDVDLGAWNWNLLDLLVENARILNPVDSYTEEDTTVIQAHETATAATATVAITKSTHTSGAYYSGQAGTQSGFFTVLT